ncbi:stringent starvation protein B [Dokdonella fugitiva]|uniref:Stringent starvation protein B n=2 Tax=Dokdonella fugitiva TaxID=328517 RepID=A0A839F2D0_9GAMM|nr:stringent starvation protein B [Dokdonella fugitiva]
MNAPAMTSNRPYLLRAFHEWISDNGLTPYLLVDAGAEGVRVPPGAAKDGRIVLNVAARAVGQFEIANDRVQFLARFGGISQSVYVPMSAVLAIYAQENGQGMMFQADGTPADPPPTAPTPDEAPKRPHLRVIK